MITRDYAEKVVKATIEAIDETVQTCAERATGSELQLPAHIAGGWPWWNYTSRIESSVTWQQARVRGNIISGQFGGTRKIGDYALMLERMDPYLRPVADQEFRLLAERVRERLEDAE